jgi:hypothetical protein
MYGRPPVAPTAASQPYGRPAVALPRHHNRTGDPRSPFLAVALSGGCPSVRSSLSAVAPAAGRQRGVILMWILMRFDGMKEKVFDPERHPAAQKVKLTVPYTKPPKDTPTVGPDQRAKDLAEHRRHMQLRYDNRGAPAG